MVFLLLWGVQSFAQLNFPQLCSLHANWAGEGGGEKVLNFPFSQGFVPGSCADLLGASCLFPRQRLSGGSYSFKRVFEQVATFQASFGDVSMDFPHGTPGRKGADGWRGLEDGLLSLPSPDKHLSGIILPGAGEKHHHHFFSRKFFSGIYP